MGKGWDGMGHEMNHLFCNFYAFSIVSPIFCFINLLLTGHVLFSTYFISFKIFSKSEENN